MIHTTVGLLIDIDIAHADILSVGLFETIEIERGIIAYIGLDDLRSKEILIISGMITEKHLDLGTLFEHNEHSTVHHQIGHLALGILRRCF